MDKLLFETLKKYLTHLKLFGYAKEQDVKAVILLMFIQEFIQDYYGYFTECDIKVINNLLNCLIGKSCMFTPSDKSLIIDYAGVGNRYNDDSYLNENYIYRVTLNNEDFRSTNDIHYLRVSL